MLDIKKLEQDVKDLEKEVRRLYGIEYEFERDGRPVPTELAVAIKQTTKAMDELSKLCYIHENL